MAIFGWLIFVVVAIYLSVVGWLAIIFGGGGLSPLRGAWPAAVFVVVAGVWYMVYLLCPFSVQLNQ